MKKSILFLLHIGFALATTSTHAMLKRITNPRRAALQATTQNIPPSSTQDDKYEQLNNELNTLLENRTDVSLKTTTLKNVQKNNPRFRGGYYHLYLLATGKNMREIVTHCSYCARELAFHKTKKLKNSYDNKIKKLVGPNGEKRKLIENLLTESNEISDHIVEQNIINKIKSTKTVKKKIAYLLLLKALYPNKGILSMYAPQKNIPYLKRKQYELNNTIKRVILNTSE